MSDFERIYKIFENATIRTEVDHPYKDDEISVTGSIDIWDNDGMNSVRLDFDSTGKFTGIYING